MAKKTTVFLVSLCLLIGLSKQESFDYIQVVYEWQPAMCNRGQHCKIEPFQNKFGIHGVWPSVYSVGPIGPCSGPSFNFTEIISLENRMSDNWPDLTNGKPGEAWARKWSNHGTCSATVFSQFEYFCMGLDTYGRHNMLSFLLRGRMFPSNSGQALTKTSFIKAIADMTSKKGGIICTADVGGRKQVQKVVLCYAKDGSTFIDCPENVSSSCPDNITWLALGQRSDVIET